MFIYTDFDIGSHRNTQYIYIYIYIYNLKKTQNKTICFQQLRFFKKKTIFQNLDCHGTLIACLFSWCH